MSFITRRALSTLIPPKVRMLGQYFAQVGIATAARTLLTELTGGFADCEYLRDPAYLPPSISYPSEISAL